MRDYKSEILRQAIAYYRGTRLTDEELRKDIEKNWPSQIDNTDLIIQKIRTK